MNQKLNEKIRREATKILESINFLQSIDDERRPGDAYDIDDNKPICRLAQVEDGIDANQKMWLFDEANGEVFTKVTDAISRIQNDLAYLVFIKKMVERNLSDELKQKVTMKSFSSYEAYGEFE